ncbi:stringent starvation protein B [Nitrosospira multiformis ATCC 25196]|uniref:Stringent starvation protein B n=1 Tax=Nitrosospira multiformis (strain ATCC 25196 / NCIMB 11849 / C 71) TaxID=323848 RepID=Q2YAB7_NITMU|nr:ClpXP protease specificity-enhancing factor [Nitrosospira multiformis]ABB74304.1 Stringent starvation protein B [Nitrosospira multiformis ATCC 25196]SEF49924.1 stringent starvation protein B [Nitrosospira multiformis ATCC 25196]
MRELSTKPYLIRAIYEWCSDCGYTPYISVKVDDNTRVPDEYVKDGEIILNISHDAAHHLTLGNEVIQFSARFAGVSREISIPLATVQGIFAKETARGMLFPAEVEPDAPQDEAAGKEADESQSSSDRPPARATKNRRLQVVK